MKNNNNKFKPFWAYEYELMEMRNNLESDCYDADNLYDAIMTGANSIRLDDEYVGYVGEDGVPDIDDNFMAENDLDLYGDDGKFVGEEKLKAIKVEFYSLDTDEDGYTIALYNTVKE